MVIIGNVGWFIQLDRRNVGHGEIEFSICLVPDAMEYRIAFLDRSGLSVIEGTVTLPLVLAKDKTNVFDLTPITEMMFWRSLGQCASSDAINIAYCRNILDDNLYKPDQCRYLLLSAIMRQVETGSSDIVQQKPRIDLSNRPLLDQEAAKNLLARQTQEAHEREMAQRAELLRQEASRTEKEKAEAHERAMRLLFDYLSPEEKKEAVVHGAVTVPVKGMGDFKVLVNGGLVHQIKDGNSVKTYCVIATDPRIPEPDVALVKIMLLKHDPNRFFEVAVTDDYTLWTRRLQATGTWSDELWEIRPRRRRRGARR